MQTGMLSPGTIASLSAALGVGSHLGYFIHGEHHMHSVRLLLLLLASPIVLFVLFIRIDDNSVVAAAWNSATAVGSYLGSLTASILIYRVCFHPLRKFPGPFSAKLTKLSHVLRLVRNLDNYLQADRLHKKYGDIVR
jgi:tryprostatin B 6-hydroxylase